jgi:hypothetical protein
VLGLMAYPTLAPSRSAFFVGDAAILTLATSLTGSQRQPA